MIAACDCSRDMVEQLQSARDAIGGSALSTRIFWTHLLKLESDWL